VVALSLLNAPHRQVTQCTRSGFRLGLVDRSPKTPYRDLSESDRDVASSSIQFQLSPQKPQGHSWSGMEVISSQFAARSVGRLLVTPWVILRCCVNDLFWRMCVFRGVAIGIRDAVVYMYWGDETVRFWVGPAHRPRRASSVLLGDRGTRHPRGRNTHRRLGFECLGEVM